MKKPISLRRITKNDLDWCRDLRNKNRKFFFNNGIISKKQQYNWFKSLNYPFFVIYFNGQPAGTIAIKKVPGHIEINNVLVSEEYRRRGILKYAVDILEKKFGLPLYVDVKINNSPAISVYKKIGFVPISYRMQKK